MNWIGGARNRMKFQNERKTQKDFFERRRLNLGNNSLLHKNQSRKRLSQDLIALQTVRNIHSAGRSSGAGQTGPIKAVDLDRFRSCTQQFKEVDIGPVSPTLNLPSKLQLMDCKGDNLKQATSTDTSFELSKSSSINDQTSVCQNDAKETWVKPNAQETWAKPNAHPFTFSKPQESNKRRSCDTQSNPFVTEDFPFTPLTKHEVSKPKRRKDSHTHHRHHEKTHSRKHKTKDGSKRFMYTSTPYDHVQDISFKGRAPANHTMNLSMDISPIGIQNMGKIELGDSYWVPTTKDELHQTNKPYSIGASGDFDNNKLATDLNNKSQIVRDDFQIHGPSYVNDKFDNGKTDRQPNLHPQGGKYDSDPCSSRSSDFTRSEDSFNRSDAQYQSGLSLFKHAHVKRSSAVQDKLSTLDRFRQQIATSPGDLNKSSTTARDLLETPTKPLIPYKPNFQDFDEEFQFTPYKEMSFQASQDIPISSTPCKSRRLNDSNYCTPVKITYNSSQIPITPANDMKSNPKPSTAELIQSTPKQPDIMTLYKEQKKTKSTENSNQSHRYQQHSPKAADKFPSHLQTQNKMIAETITAQKKLGPKEKMAGKDPYKISTSHQDMSDVLQEMHQLETEEINLNKASQERHEVLDNTVIYQDTTEPTSVSFEADRFFESEQHEIMEEKLQEIPDNEIKTGTMKNETEPENIQKIDNKATTISAEYIAVPLNTTEEFSCSNLDIGKTENEVQVMDTSIGFDVNTFAEHFPPADEIDGQVLDKLDKSKQDNENPCDLKSSNSESNLNDTASRILSNNQDTNFEMDHADHEKNIEKDNAELCVDKCTNEQTDSNCCVVDKCKDVEDNFHDNDTDSIHSKDNSAEHNIEAKPDNYISLPIAMKSDDLEIHKSNFTMVNMITDEHDTKPDADVHQSNQVGTDTSTRNHLINISQAASKASSPCGLKVDAQQSNDIKNAPVNSVTVVSKVSSPYGQPVNAQQSNEVGTEIRNKSGQVNVVPAVSKASSSYSLTVQDPEVSSGINRGVQCSIKQSLVDRGTSPFILNKEKEFVDIGVQCVESYVNIGQVHCDRKLELKMQLQDNEGILSTEEITEHSKEE